MIALAVVIPSLVCLGFGALCGYAWRIRRCIRDEDAAFWRGFGEGRRSAGL